MDRKAVVQRLTEIFQDVFDDDTLRISDSMTARDVEGWDSLTHINLVVAVEKAFKVKLTTAEVRDLTKVGDLITLVVRKTS